MKIKYAIYQGDVGKFALEYCDNMNSVKNHTCAPYVKEEDLPILINDVGGKISFKDWNKDNFICIKEVEENEEPLTREEKFPKNPKSFKYGWIDLDGNVYSTGVEGHYDASKMICKELYINTYNPERTLEELNWIKTTKVSHMDDFVCFVEKFKITQAQIETLKKYELDKYYCVQMLIKYNSGEI